MTFSVRYRQVPSGAESQHWIASLTEAKLHASEVVTSGSAERAEVRDQMGQLIYQYPEDTVPE